MSSGTTRTLVLLVVLVVVGAGSAAADDEPVPPSDLQPVLMTPTGHAEMVLAVAFSPDGRHVLTGSDDTTAQLWETATGRGVRRFEGHAKGVHSVAFSPDGTHVLTGSTDGTVRLWEAATGKEVRRFEGHDKAVRAAAYAPDGRLVATASDDNTARLWDAATGREVRSLVGHTNSVVSVAFSPDGRHLLTGSSDRTVRLWETETGMEVGLYDEHTATVHALAFSPDGALFLAGYWDMRPRLWNLETGEDVRPFVGDTMGSPSVAFAPDGTHVLTGSRDGSARLWATATGQQVRRFGGHGGEVYAAAFSPDGTHVVTGAYDRTARLWETATGKEVRRFEGHARTVQAVRSCPGGVNIVVGSRDGTAGLWDADVGHEVRRYEGHRKGVTSVDVSHDGQQVLTGSYDGTARLWTLVTCEEVRRFEGHAGAVNAVAFSPDGTQVLTGSKDKTVRLWDASTGREARRFTGHSESVHAVAFSPDGKYVLAGSRDGTAGLWEAATGRGVRRFAGHGKWVAAVAFSPDGTQVLTGSWDRTARLWETATGRVLRSFEGHTQGVVSVAFSPDGTEVLTGSWDKTARLWDPATGAEVKRLEGHTGEVFSALYAPGGERILTASADATAGVWDVATGRELCSLRSFTDGTWAVVDESGRFDASNGGDVPGLHWVVGMEVIALDQLKDRYFEPGLLAKHLGRSSEPLRDVAPFSKPRLYPDVRVEHDQGALRVHVDSQGGGIGRVVVMVNGKERTADARGPSPDPNAETLTLVEDLKDDPRLLPGEENRIEVFAYNAEGYLRSRGVAVAFVPEGEQQVPALWAVVAGVSDYGGTKLDLRFAAKDALDFAKAVTTAGKALFGADNTHVKVLSDASVQRESLVAALEELRQAKAGDILLLYLAGHGVTHGDGFYYLTAGAETTDLSEAGHRDTQTLSSAELIEAIKQIPALKQVLILDTCSSGSFIDVLTGARGVPSSQVRALERVKDRTGTYVLAGCAADKQSYEATIYGQGLLTYSLLLGMKGGQLHEKEFVDVSTLFNFAADKVPEFAREAGRTQRPVVASPRGGSSFYIGRLTQEALAEIPLSQARPLLLPSSFLDANEGADLLDLGQGVDEVLGEEAARGHDAAFHFLPAATFPGSFRLSGTYTTLDGTTTVRFKLRRDKEAVTEWIEVVGRAADLSRKILEEAKRSLATLGG